MEPPLFYPDRRPGRATAATAAPPPAVRRVLGSKQSKGVQSGSAPSAGCLRGARPKARSVSTGSYPASAGPKDSSAGPTQEWTIWECKTPFVFTEAKHRRRYLGRRGAIREIEEEQEEGKAEVGADVTSDEVVFGVDEGECLGFD